MAVARVETSTQLRELASEHNVMLLHVTANPGEPNPPLEAFMQQHPSVGFALVAAGSELALGLQLAAPAFVLMHNGSVARSIAGEFEREAIGALLAEAPDRIGTSNGALKRHRSESEPAPTTLDAADYPVAIAEEADVHLGHGHGLPGPSLNADVDAPTGKRQRLEAEQPNLEVDAAGADGAYIDFADAPAPARSNEPGSVEHRNHRSPTPVPVPQRATEAAAVSLSWRDLFGELPREELLEGELVEDPFSVVDPELLDVQAVLSRCFGPKVGELDVDLHQSLDALERVILAQRIEESMDEVDECFGSSCRTKLLSKPGVRFAPLDIRYAKAPVNPLHPRDGPITKEKPGLRSRMLVDLPTIYPNTQTLHVEPLRYLPQELQVPVSGERALYTTQNVMRWSYHPGQKKFFSNSRLVHWSDGSLTLHVGSDVYELFTTRDNALHLLAGDAVDDHTGRRVVVESVPLDRHCAVRPASGVPNSVEAAIQAQSNAERAVELQSRLPVPIDALPDFNVEKDKKAPRVLAISAEEEFVKMRRQLREKQFPRGATMTEFVRHEVETFRMLEQARKESRLKELIAETQQRAQRKPGGGPARGLSQLDLSLASQDAYGAANQHQMDEAAVDAALDSYLGDSFPGQVSQAA